MTEELMGSTMFDAWTRRRFGLVTSGATIALLGPAGRDGAAAKKKKKKCKIFCRKDGSPCTKKGSKCKAGFCLTAPFTIEANWTVEADHDAVLFVPTENDATGPFPFIFFDCVSSPNLSCDVDYPFACFSGDVQTSGSEIATIFQVLPGTYEYWNEIDGDTEAGELTIVLRDNGGRIMRQWTNPANPGSENGWHVFDIDGNTGLITSIDELIDGGVPEGAHDPSTNVCP
jgi:hypothetical protein